MIGSRDRLLTKALKPRLRKIIAPSAEAALYSPVFRAQKHSCDSVARVCRKRSSGAVPFLIPLRRFGGGMGVQRDVGGNPSIPPSSFWAQRSAQPAGIHKNILSKCIRIVIVAFGSAPIPDNFRFAIRYVRAAALKPAWGFHPQTPSSLRAYPRFLVSNLSRFPFYLRSSTLLPVSWFFPFLSGSKPQTAA